MIFLIVAAGAFALDYVLKEKVNSTCIQGSQKKILGGKLILRNCHNEGMAFGLLKELEPEYCQELSALALGGIVWEFLRHMLHGGSRLGKLGLSMVMGGGFGNYAERLQKGSVTDYVGFGVKNKKIRRLTFNAADFFIIAGGILWVVSMFLPAKKKK